MTRLRSEPLTTIATYIKSSGVFQSTLIVVRPRVLVVILKYILDPPRFAVFCPSKEAACNRQEQLICVLNPRCNGAGKICENKG